MDKIQYKPWSIRTELPMKQEKEFLESVFSQGNGYMGLRGTLPEDATNKSYERCAYIAGVFDYIKAGITDMVNTPDYMISKISMEGEYFDPLQADEIIQELNLRDGTLSRDMLWTTAAGGSIKIRSTRFLSLADVHTAAIRYEITPVNCEGVLEFETGIDAGISNQPIADDQMKQNEDVISLVTAVTAEMEEELAVLLVKTNSLADIWVAYAFSLEAEGKCQDIIQNGYIGKKTSVMARKGEVLVYEKLISVYTSRECGKAELLSAVKEHARQNARESYSKLYQRTGEAWRKRWQTADIEIAGDDRVQSALRFNLFQLIQTNSSKDCTVNIGARGIMHGRYKGCYFWDTDIFMLPFYTGTHPEAARNLVKYRYLGLGDARENARQMNLKGARYPWMCSIDGREQCESWDIGSSEVHVTADVAYAVDHYCREADDLEFLFDYGVELYIETARYWASRLTYNKAQDAYDLMFVKGPDEYCGITSNNTYTNWLIRYNLEFALNGIARMEKEAPDKLKELLHRLSLSGQEQEEWKCIVRKIRILYNEEEKLYLQDETFHRLEPLDIASHKTDAAPLYRRICFDRLQRYQVLKQADLLLLMTMRPEDFTMEQKRAAWNYYEPRTLHDSSLSYGVHSLLASDLGESRSAWDYFTKSLFLDIENVMENTGKEGLHFAAFGITWQAVVRGFAGLRTGDGVLQLEPKLPAHWEKLRFSYRFRGRLYQIEINRERAVIRELDET